MVRSIEEKRARNRELAAKRADERKKDPAALRKRREQNRNSSKTYRGNNLEKVRKKDRDRWERLQKLDRFQNDSTAEQPGPSGLGENAATTSAAGQSDCTFNNVDPSGGMVGIIQQRTPAQLPGNALGLFNSTEMFAWQNPDSGGVPMPVNWSSFETSQDNAMSFSGHHLSPSQASLQVCAQRPPPSATVFPSHPPSTLPWSSGTPFSLPASPNTRITLTTFPTGRDPVSSSQLAPSQQFANDGDVFRGMSPLSEPPKTPDPVSSSQIAPSQQLPDDDDVFRGMSPWSEPPKTRDPVSSNQIAHSQQLPDDDDVFRGISPLSAPPKTRDPVSSSQIAPSQQLPDDDDVFRGMSPLSEPPKTPPPLKTRPYVIPPPQLPKVDLLADVLGVQVDQSAENVVWPSGWKTVVPTAIRNGLNVLEADAERVRWLANPENAVSSQLSTVKYLDKSAYSTSKDLIEDIRALNAQNFTVVVPGGVPQNGKKFETYDDLNFEFGLGVGESLNVQYHDLEKRATQILPHTLTTVSDFVNKINDPETVGMVLDLPTSKQAIPAPFHLLDESVAAFHQIKSDQSAKAFKLNVPLHLDSFLAPTWALMHHAGTFTNVHQDAEGFSVAGQVLGDRDDPQPKIWAIMSFKDPSVVSTTPKEMAERMAFICRYVNEKRGREWHWDDSRWQECQVDLMYLRPGDMFFQPPGALHVVYTPRACVASGGHYYSYDSLHLTEWTRRIQHFQSNVITNQSPARVKEVLNLMMLNFPNMTGRVFHKRAVAALCRMVLADHDYVHQGQQKKKLGNDLDRRAEAMAELVANLCLGAPYPAAKHRREVIVEHLTELLQTDDYRDQGEPFMLSLEVVNIIEQTALEWMTSKPGGRKKN